MRFFKFCLVLCAFALFALACTENTAPNSNTANANRPATNSAPAANTQPAATATVDEVAATKKIYSEKCANCHKEDGTGGKVTIEGKTLNAENLTTDKMKKMPDAKYVEYIENGIPDEGMPAFKGKLTDEQIKNLVAYIRKEFQKQ